MRVALLARVSAMDTVPYTDDADHAHHWRIDPPAGPTSTGRCRTCGSERAFSNVHMEDAAQSWRSLEKRR